MNEWYLIEHIIQKFIFLLKQIFYRVMFFKANKQTSNWFRAISITFFVVIVIITIFSLLSVYYTFLFLKKAYVASFWSTDTDERNLVKNRAKKKTVWRDFILIHKTSNSSWYAKLQKQVNKKNSLFFNCFNSFT